MSISMDPASASQPAAVPGLPEYPAITLITKLLVIGGWAVLAMGVLVFLGTCLSALLNIGSVSSANSFFGTLRMDDPTGQQQFQRVSSANSFFGTLRFLALVLFYSLQALLYAAVTSALCFAAAYGLRTIRDIAHNTYISAHR